MIRALRLAFFALLVGGLMLPALAGGLPDAGGEAVPVAEAPANEPMAVLGHVRPVGDRAFVIPFWGPPPRFRATMVDPRYHYFDFEPARLSKKDVQAALTAHGGAQFRMAPRPGGRGVRIVLHLDRDAMPSVTLDEAAHHLLVIRPFAGPVPGGSLSAQPAPGWPYADQWSSLVQGLSELRAPYSLSDRAIVLPYSGVRPAIRVSQQGRDLMVTFSRSRYRPGTVLHGRLYHPLATGWRIERRGSPAVLALRLRGAVGYTLEDHDELNQVWLVPGPTLAQAPTPEPTPGPDGSYQVPVPISVIAPGAPAPRAPAPAADGTRTWFESAVFDASRDAFVLSYGGAAPVYGLTRTDDRTMQVVFPRSQPPAGPHGASLPQHWLLRNWQLVSGPASGASTLSLALAGPGELLVAVDRARHQLLLLPQLKGQEAAPPPGPSGLRSVLSPASFEPTRRWIMIPYYGGTPVYAVNRVASDQVYVDFGNALMNPVTVQVAPVQQFPLLTQWVMAPRPDRRDVRLALKVPFGGNARVLDDREGKRLVVEIRLEGDQPAPPPATSGP